MGPNFIVTCELCKSRDVGGLQIQSVHRWRSDIDAALGRGILTFFVFWWATCKNVTQRGNHRRPRSYASDQWQHRCGFTGSISIKLPEETSKQAASRCSWRQFLWRMYALIDHKVSNVAKFQSQVSLEITIWFLLFGWTKVMNWIILGQLHNYPGPMICMTQFQ